MWTAAVLVAASCVGLASNDSQDLKIANARFTYGLFGMERTDAAFLPPDFMAIAFDLVNVSRDRKTGKVVFSLQLEYLNSKGKRVYRHDDRNVEELAAMGGSRVSTFAFGDIGRDTAPGKYTLRMTVTDRITKKKAVWHRDFEVVKHRFGFNRVNVPAVGFAGQMAQVKFFVQGFQRNSKKEPNLQVWISFFDENKKPTLPEAIRQDFPPKDLPEGTDLTKVMEIPLETQFFRLSRPGKFTVQLGAYDNVAKKRITMECKLTVLDARKYESAK